MLVVFAKPNSNSDHCDADWIYASTLNCKPAVGVNVWDDTNLLKYALSPFGSTEYWPYLWIKVEIFGDG